MVRGLKKPLKNLICLINQRSILQKPNDLFVLYVKSLRGTVPRPWRLDTPPPPCCFLPAPGAGNYMPNSSSSRCVKASDTSACNRIPSNNVRRVRPHTSSCARDQIYSFNSKGVSGSQTRNWVDVRRVSGFVWLLVVRNCAAHVVYMTHSFCVLFFLASWYWNPSVWEMHRFLLVSVFLSIKYPYWCCLDDK